MDKTILLIPWEDDVFHVVRLTLEQSDYNVILADWFVHQIQFNEIKHLCRMHNPRLLVTQMRDFDQMRDANSYRLCKLMKADSETKAVGLIDICPIMDSDDSCKIDGVVRTPFGPAKLMQKIKWVMNKVSQ